MKKPNLRSRITRAPRAALSALGVFGLIAGLAVSTAPTVASATPTLTGTASATTTLYAAPSGTGTTCTAAAPCSVTQAQTSVRSLIASAPATNYAVILRGGTYRLAAPLNFNRSDAGTGGVTWQAAPGETPVFSGAVAATNWTKHDATRNIYVADVPSDVNTRQLYINGQRAPIAQTTAAEQGFYVTSGGPTGQTTNTRWASTLAGKVSALNLTRVEFVWRSGNGPWTEPRCRIQNASGADITMQQPCWHHTTQRPEFRDATGQLPNLPQATTPTAIENSYEFLHEGQWYLDLDTHKLYYMAMPGQDPNTMSFEVPKLQQLLYVSGSLDAPAENLHFKGITFTGATWLDPSEKVGFAEVQDNLRLTSTNFNVPQALCEFHNPRGSCPFGSLTRPPGTVTFLTVRNSSITDSTFTHLGAAGLVVENGSRNVNVIGNRFEDISSTGIIIGSTQDPTPADVFETDRQITKDITVSNNVVTKAGNEFHGSAGITLFFAQNLKIINNHLYDLPYTGISAGVIQGHVNDMNHPDNAKNVNSDNIIGNNLIHQVMQTLKDGGAIYVEGHQGQYKYNADGTVNRAESVKHGLQAINNVAYEMGTSNFTWYNDAGSQWINWSGNVAWTGIYSHGGCSAIGRLDYKANWQSNPVGQFQCTPAIDYQVTGNTGIPQRPTTDDVPAAKFSQVGLMPEYAAKLEVGPPQVKYVQVKKNGTYFVAGVNLSKDTVVTFNTGAATAKTLLGSGFMEVTAPAGTAPTWVTVTQAGASDSYSITDKNLALKKPATQVSTYVEADGYSYPASNVVDGTTGTFQTTKNQAQPWVKIDLGSVKTIKKVEIYNRTDGCCTERVANYAVMLASEPFTASGYTANVKRPHTWVSEQTAAAGVPTTITVPSVQARYVMVQLQGTNEIGMSEIKVFN